VYIFEDVERALNILIAGRSRSIGSRALTPISSLPTTTCFDSNLSPPSRLNAIEIEHEEFNVDIKVDVDNMSGDVDSIFAALLMACQATGFDASHEKRQELVHILESVEQGGAFPDIILKYVEDKTKLLSAAAVTELLRSALKYTSCWME
jgi:hypothetical protein